MLKLKKSFNGSWLASLAVLQLLLGLSIQAQTPDIQKNLVAYWAFEGDFKDSVGKFDGTANGADPIAFVDGKPGFGKAGKFNGEDQFVEITGGEPDDLAFEGGNLSVSVWFKVDTFDTSWQALVAKGEGGNWRIHRRNAEQGMAYTGGPSGDTPAGKAVDDGQWHHLVAITDKDAVAFGTALYIDGLRDTQLDAPQVLAANGLRMRIADNPGAPSREWEGEIDDIGIWDRVLTEDEIKALYANGAGKSISSFFGTRIEILGLGAESLLGGDLTDPDNNGKDEAGAASDPSWNWAGITSSHEPDFEGGENSFNIFDNKVGGGNDKWCCDDPTPGNPVWVAVQFPNPVSLTHFTVTSGNDTPTRDPTDWAIQGSADGASYTDIYHMTPITNPVVPWTDRNQVVKFTLPAASPTYRYIRYIAYATPADLHQINEVELFGIIGGTQVAFIGGIRSTITSFSFNLNDAGSSVVDPASVKLVFDGANIALGTLTKVAGKIDVTYTPATPFPPGSNHTYAISAKDGSGNNITSDGNFTTLRYALLTPGDKVTPDTSKPGFIFNVHQNAAFQANDNVRPAQQLLGLLGVNQADPAAQGVAIGLGKPGANANLPIGFEIDTVINMSQSGGEANGNVPDDGQMPGIPGTDGGIDGIAAEVLYFVDLPAGSTTFIVNSDDGFITTAGLVADAFKAQFAGQFSGGRGAADTAYTVFAETAGVYAFRTVWEEGGGGANLEILTVKADGTKVLVNDTANGGLKSYRVGVGQTVISSVNPPVGATGVGFDTSVGAILIDGAPVVDAASVKLTLDTAAVAATATKTNGVTTISFKPASFFAPGSLHTATITFTAGGTARTESWEFTIANYGTLTAAHIAVSFDTTKPGFIWNVFQNETFTHTSLALTEDALAGNLKNGTTPITNNLANPAAPGIASGNGVKVGPLFKFEIPTVINLSQVGGEANGNFPDDAQMPGIPGTTGLDDGIDGEVITFVELPAGVVTMGVDSDDGFRTQAGYINVPADGVVLGQFDGGRGAADTIFKFLVETAGVYPLRTIWQEGGGGANLEIFTVKADGTKVLVNDTANGGVKAYRVGVAPNKSAQSNPNLTATKTGNNLTIAWTPTGGRLQSTAVLAGAATVWKDEGTTNPATVPISGSALFLRVISP